jgi:L-ascorbate metabolism protein UlaG (beta-lactamase superfamily)
MKLKWLGHAAFRITSSDGVSVITDPHNPETSGYAPYREPCDIVIMSSDNDLFHCNTHLVPGEHITINALELARSGAPRVEHGIAFSAIEAMEALDHREHDPDQNGMYRMVVDGVAIGHMGDVGNALSPAQIDFFRGVDVLLALTGGHPTIALPDLKHVIEATRPKLVVPMHFRTLTYKPRNMLWIEPFLNDYNNDSIDFALAAEVDINRERLPSNTRILVVDYAH